MTFARERAYCRSILRISQKVGRGHDGRRMLDSEIGQNIGVNCKIDMNMSVCEREAMNERVAFLQQHIHRVWCGLRSEFKHL